MSIGRMLEKDLTMKRYHCPHCGYTWMEFVGHIVEKRKGLDDLHIRIGDGTPSECQKCGCCFVFEAALSEKNQTFRGRFEGIKIVTHAARPRVELRT